MAFRRARSRRSAEHGRKRRAAQPERLDAHQCRRPLRCRRLPARPQEAAMSYYFSKVLHTDFGKAVERTIEALKQQGFGITEIDVKETLRKKLDLGFRNYRILGACNPSLAHEALRLEDKIGTMLPCNVVVQEIAPGTIEIAAIDPVASMQAVDNPALKRPAFDVQERLKKVVAGL
jgi:uncharacterized protein (DUF302 family)